MCELNGPILLLWKSWKPDPYGTTKYSENLEVTHINYVFQNMTGKERHNISSGKIRILWTVLQ